MGIIILWLSVLSVALLMINKFDKFLDGEWESEDNF